MAVEVKLQAEGGPRRHAQVAQAELRIEKVEVVVQALALGGLEHGPARQLVVPGPERGAGFHGREDVHQAGMISALSQDRLDAGFLAEVLALDEVDGQAGFAGHLLGVGPEVLPQGGSPLWIVEQPDVTGRQVGSHGSRVSDVRQGARDHHAVKARQRPPELGSVSLDEGLHGRDCRSAVG